MPDITLGTIRTGSNSVVELVQFGEDVLVGQTVAWDSASKRYLLATSVNKELSIVRGFVISPNMTDKWGWIHKQGDLEIGNTSAGVPLYQSSTPGAVRDDLELGAYVTSVGIGIANAIVPIEIVASETLHTP